MAQVRTAQWQPPCRAPRAARPGGPTCPHAAQRPRSTVASSFICGDGTTPNALHSVTVSGAPRSCILCMKMDAALHAQHALCTSHTHTAHLRVENITFGRQRPLCSTRLAAAHMDHAWIDVVLQGLEQPLAALHASEARLAAQASAARQELEGLEAELQAARSARVQVEHIIALCTVLKWTPAAPNGDAAAAPDTGAPHEGAAVPQPDAASARGTTCGPRADAQPAAAGPSQHSVPASPTRGRRSRSPSAERSVAPREPPCRRTSSAPEPDVPLTPSPTASPCLAHGQRRRTRGAAGDDPFRVGRQVVKVDPHHVYKPDDCYRPRGHRFRGVVTKQMPSGLLFVHWYRLTAHLVKGLEWTSEEPRTAL